MPVVGCGICTRLPAPNNKKHRCMFVAPVGCCGRCLHTVLQVICGQWWRTPLPPTPVLQVLCCAERCGCGCGLLEVCKGGGLSDITVV